MTRSEFSMTMSRGDRSLLGSIGGSLATVVASRFLSQNKSNITPMPKSRSSASSTITRKRRKTKSGSRNSFAAKSRALKPTKQWTDNVQLEGLTHNTIYSYSPTQGLIQGTNNAERNGDEVYLTGLRIRGFNFTETGAAGYALRVMVGWTGEEYTMPSTFISGGLAHNEIFLPSTGATWVQSGIVNPKAFTLLHDQTFTMNSLISDVADLNQFDQFIPLGKKYQYQAGSTNHGKFKDLVVIVMANVVGGTDDISLAGDIFISTSLSFKE